MRYGLSDKIIKKIHTVFIFNADIKKAIIYGSRAMNTYRNGSDIDITLKGNLNLDDLLRIENQLEDQMLPYKFDLSLFYKIENKDLLSHIDRIGKVFYEKTTN